MDKKIVVEFTKVLVRNAIFRLSSPGEWELTVLYALANASGDVQIERTYEVRLVNPTGSADDELTAAVEAIKDREGLADAE